MPAMSNIAPAAVNLHGPASWLLGAQQMSMLEAMHASSPPTAPTTPGSPPMKPTSEKMELPQKWFSKAQRPPVQHVCQQDTRHVFFFAEGWRTIQSTRRQSTWPCSPPWEGLGCQSTCQLVDRSPASCVWANLGAVPCVGGCRQFWRNRVFLHGHSGIFPICKSRKQPDGSRRRLPGRCRRRRLGRRP